MKPEIGTLYVAPNGDAYRLRDYGIDWQAEPFTGEHEVPDYSVALVAGGFTARHELPDGSVVVWSPQARSDADRG